MSKADASRELRPEARLASSRDGGSGEPPPLLGRWGHLYALVALELLGVILALLWLTRRFA